jgi:hypothetical protein
MQDHEDTQDLDAAAPEGGGPEEPEAPEAPAGELDLEEIALLDLGGTTRTEGALQVQLPPWQRAEVEAFAKWLAAPESGVKSDGSRSSYKTYVTTMFIAVNDAVAEDESLSFGEAILEIFPKVSANVRSGIRKYREFKLATA